MDAIVVCRISAGCALSIASATIVMLRRVCIQSAQRHLAFVFVHVKGSLDAFIFFKERRFGVVVEVLLASAFTNADEAGLFLARLASGEGVEVGFFGRPPVANVARHDGHAVDLDGAFAVVAASMSAL